jgi:hypothetical protein
MSEAPASTGVALPNRPRPLVTMDLEALMAGLDERYAADVAQVDKHVEAHSRFVAQFGDKGLPDADAAGKAADWVKKQLLPLDKSLDGQRTFEKEGPLESGRMIDRWFSGPRNKLDVIVRSARALLTRFAEEQESKKRETLRLQAQREQEEAERQARLAERTGNDTLMGQAVAGEQRAEDLKAKAEAPIVKTEPVRGSFGGTVSMRTTWSYEIEDIGKVPTIYLLVNERLVKAAITSAPKKDGVPQITIPGLKIVAIRSAV